MASSYFFLGERIFGLAGLDALRSRQYATLAAAFFLVHPVQTESVTYISSRSELLSTFFYLTGFLVYVFWPKEKIGFLCSLAVAVPYFFGLGSKETVITLAATIFLYDFLFLSKADFRSLLTRWRFYAIYLLGCTAAIYYLLTTALRGTVGSSVSVNLSWWHYFLTELRVIVRYVQLVFLPVGLNLDYDFRSSSSPLEPAVIASFLFLLGLYRSVGGFAGVHRFYRSRSFGSLLHSHQLQVWCPSSMSFLNIVCICPSSAFVCHSPSLWISFENNSSSDSAFRVRRGDTPLLFCFFSSLAPSKGTMYGAMRYVCSLTRSGSRPIKNVRTIRWHGPTTSVANLIKL